MSRRRQQRRAQKAHRHLQANYEPCAPIQQSPAAIPRVLIREARQVERLAYTRSQAAQALGISRSTLCRLLPYVETIEMPWGAKLIPVDELERLVAERRRTAQPRLAPARGRKPTVSPQIAKRIRNERSTGKSLRQIAASLNADAIPTAHGGAQWWPSTVRHVLLQPSRHGR
jgi:Recombinase